MSDLLKDIYESINDKYLFKCAFMAGGTGSGKSLVSNLMFKGQPVKFVNSDIYFEKLLKKRDLPFTLDKSNLEVYPKQMDARQAAKVFAGQVVLYWINGMLPLIIDGTGKDYEKIQKQKELLSDIGYDCAMVFVNTSLDVALDRNRKRARSVSEDIATTAWKAANDNIGKFQSLFGISNFFIIDNSKVLSDKEMKGLELDLTRKAMKYLSSPLSNKIGINILKMLNISGGLYLSDIPNFDKEKIKFKV